MTPSSIQRRDGKGLLLSAAQNRWADLRSSTEQDVVENGASDEVGEGEGSCRLTVFGSESA